MFEALAAVWRCMRTQPGLIARLNASAGIRVEDEAPDPQEWEVVDQIFEATRKNLKSMGYREGVPRVELLRETIRMQGYDADFILRASGLA